MEYVLQNRHLHKHTHTNANTQSCIPPHLFWHAWCWQSRNNFLCLYRHCWLAPRGECRRCWQWGRGGGSDGGSSKWHAHLSCEGDWEEHAGKLWPSPLSPSTEPVAILPCRQKKQHFTLSAKKQHFTLSAKKTAFYPVGKKTAWQIEECDLLKSLIAGQRSEQYGTVCYKKNRGTMLKKRKKMSLYCMNDMTLVRDHLSAKDTC